MNCLFIYVFFFSLLGYPDVEIRDITEDWEFVVLACDGIWDVLTNEEVLEFVRRRIGLGLSPEQICEELMTRCLAPDCQMGGLGGDNMTVVLVCFLHKQSYDDLVIRCASQMMDKELNNMSRHSSSSSVSLSITPPPSQTPPSPHSPMQQQQQQRDSDEIEQEREVNEEEVPDLK